jgi:hypothetical protein
MEEKDILNSVFGTIEGEAKTEEEKKEEQERKIEEELMDEEHKRLASKFNFYNGNGNAEINREALLNEKITKQDIDFVIEMMTKEAENDGISIKQLLYGMFSGFTKIPMHHVVNSKSAGAGKSYLLTLVSDYFPRRYVLVLIGASDKALQHRGGIMVLEDADSGELTEVEPIINKMRTEIIDYKQGIETEKLRKKDKNMELIINLQKKVFEKEEEIKSVIDCQEKLIILSDTIILFLDTPQEGFYDGLMALLSNDSNRDQKYIFTDKTASGKLLTRVNIMRGAPVMFTTRVIDDTRNQRFEERNRRFIIVTPNVSAQKIEDANALMLKEVGLTPEEYDISVVSREDREKGKRIISIIVEKLRNHSKFLAPRQYGIKIPFIEAIKVPSNAEWSMTVMRRLVGYLSIITKVNMDNRPRLVRKDNPNLFLPISTFEDLRETLDLMERGGTNIRPYVTEWYNEVFLPAFKAENRAKTKDIESREGVITIQENYRAVTSTQLREKTKEVKHISISSDDLRHKFIDPLINQGLIEKARSEIRKSENIYFPVDETGENIFSLFSSEDLKLTVKDPCLYPYKGIIMSAFSRHFENQAQKKHRDSDSGILEKNILDIYRLEDSDGLEITPERLADKYFSDPESCFIKDFQDKNNLEV